MPKYGTKIASLNKYYRRQRRSATTLTKSRMNYKLSRGMISGKNAVYSYKQTFLGAVINSAGGAPTAVAYKFVLNDLPQVATLTALYDEYCITKVVVKFVPQGTIGDNPDPSSWKVCPFYTVIDYDDATTPVTLNELMEYQTLKHTKGNVIHKRILTPRISTLAYKTSGTTIGYSSKGRQYVDCANPDIEHYGVKCWIPATGGATAGVVSMQPIITYYVKFRGVR